MLEKELKAAEIDYTPYFLEKNPFPINPIASPESPFCEEVREKELETIMKESIVPAFKERSGAHIWVFGDWGVGKSAFLIHCSKEVKNALKKEAASIYVDTIGSGISDITRKVISNLREEFFREMRNRLLSNMAIENMDNIVVARGLEAFIEGVNTKAKKKMIRQQLEQDPNAIIKLMGSGVIDKEKLIGVTSTKLVEAGCSKRFVDIFNDLVEDVGLAYFEMSRKLKDVEDIISIFKAIELSGIKMAYLYIDQFENQIISYREDAEANFIRDLCDLIDGCKNSLTIIMSVTPELSGQMAKSVTYNRLLGHPRMPLERRVILTPLNEQKTIALVKAYLKLVRKKDTPPTVSDLHPFTQDAIDEILKRRKGLPGRMLLDCRRLLELGAKKGFVRIDKEFVIEK